MGDSSGTDRGRTVALCDSHPDTIDLLRGSQDEDDDRAAVQQAEERVRMREQLRRATSGERLPVIAQSR